MAHNPVDVAFAIEHLGVSYRQGGGEVRVVEDVSLSLNAGEILGIAGESGCGKSTAVLASTGFPIPGMASRQGRALLGDTDLLSLSSKQLPKFWGRRIAYLPQDASTSLTPTARIGRLFAESLKAHLGLDRAAVKQRTGELMESVGLPSDQQTLSRYAFEFSGGQQQRIALAIALACRPDVLILDEPTTGLDVTTQAVVSALVRELVDSSGTATIYVSHDLRLLRHMCDRIAVMYAGQVVEISDSKTMWDAPRDTRTPRPCSTPCPTSPARARWCRSPELHRRRWSPPPARFGRVARGRSRRVRLARWRCRPLPAPPWCGASAPARVTWSAGSRPARPTAARPPPPQDRCSNWSMSAAPIGRRPALPPWTVCRWPSTTARSSASWGRAARASRRFCGA